MLKMWRANLTDELKLGDETADPLKASFVRADTNEDAEKYNAAFAKKDGYYDPIPYGGLWRYAESMDYCGWREVTDEILIMETDIHSLKTLRASMDDEEPPVREISVDDVIAWLEEEKQYILTFDNKDDIPMIEATIVLVKKYGSIVESKGC